MKTELSLAEIKNLVRDIQSFLSGPLNPEDEPDIIDMSCQHDEIVVAVNERADEVAELLDRGLNDEAIQLADQAPPLTDLCMTLDFQGLADWASLLAEFEISPVTELPHETIAQLEDAYAVNADSKKLLQRFRLLSLSRAPLPKRIDVLRRLAAKDPENDQWVDGIRSYEAHRIKSIQKDLKAARDRGDLTAVAGIDREVNAAEWLVPIPESLRTDSRTAHRKLREADARKRLVPLATELSAAYAEFNVSKATTLLGKFRGLQDVANVPPDHEVMDIAAPAIDWIEGELQKQHSKVARDQSIAKLRAGLDANAPLHQLEKHYYAATESGEPVPQVLETRLANRITADETAAKRKRLLTIIGSVVALTVMVAGVVWFVTASAFNSRAQKNVEQITQLLDDAETSGNTGPVESRFADLEANDASMLEVPEVAALLTKLQALQAKEDGRVRSFNTLLDTTRQVANNPTWPTLASGQKALADAEALVKNSTERAALLDARKSIDITAANLQENSDQEFTNRLVAIDALMAKVRPTDPNSFDAPISKLQIAMSLPHVSEDVLSQGKARMSKLNTERRSAQKKKSIATDLVMITDRISTPQAFETALRTYIRNHGKVGRGQDMEDVLKFESKLWTDVPDWNSFRTEIPKQLNSLRPDAATKLHDKIVAFQKNNFLGGMRLDETARTLKSISRRSTSILGAERKLQEMFDGPFVDKLYVVQLQSGWYYCSEPPKQNRSGSKVDFTYYENGFAAKAEESKSADNEKILNVKFRPQSPDDFWLSGQSKLRSKIQATASKKDTPFEEKIQESMSLLLEVDDIDPIFHLLLVENTLALGRTGSRFIEAESEAVTKELAKIPISRSSDWLKPDTQLQVDRSRARRQLGELKDLLLKSLSDAIKVRDMKLAQPQAGAMQMAGWMHRDTTGDWVISLSTAYEPISDDELWMLYINPQTGKAAITVVAQIQFASPTLRSVLPSRKEGRPVFAFKR